MNPSANRRLKPTIVAAALLALGSLPGLAADSSIAFTLTGTATRGVCGYIYGESYDFTWVLNGGFTNNASSFFTGTFNDWCEDLVSETPLYSDVSGDGLTGTWQRPVAEPGAPYSYLMPQNSAGVHELDFYASSDGMYPIGLQADGVNVRTVSGYAKIGNIFTFPGSYTDPNVYFAGLTGTYAASDGVVEVATTSDTARFAVTSVAISVVPEPSGSLLAGLGLAALVLCRRRGRG